MPGCGASCCGSRLSVVGEHRAAAGGVAVQGWLQTALWMLALVVDYVGTALGGASGLAAAARRAISPNGTA